MPRSGHTGKSRSHEALSTYHLAVFSNPSFTPTSGLQFNCLIALSMLATRLRMVVISSAYSEGTVYQTVSGMFRIVAPSSMAASSTRHRKSMSVRVASSGENSTSALLLRAYRTA